MKENISEFRIRKHRFIWLFFDVGSTLVDEQFAYVSRFNDIARLSGRSYEEVYETAVECYKKNLKGDLEAARQFGVSLTKWHSEDEVLYDDAASCLAVLREKYRIGIIANQALGTEERLKNHGILQYIDLVVASAEEGVAKPDPKIFELALERANCAAANAVMIGDRIDNDIIPAKRLGMQTVWIRQGFGRHWKITDKTETPDMIVNCLTELCDIL